MKFTQENKKTHTSLLPGDNGHDVINIFLFNDVIYHPPPHLLIIIMLIFMTCRIDGYPRRLRVQLRLLVSQREFMAHFCWRLRCLSPVL